MPESTNIMLVSLILSMIAVISLLWGLPKYQARRLSNPDPKARFDVENEARKTLAQIMGGILLLGGFYATWRTAALAEKSYNLSQQGQITDRFTKAIEQLGSTAPDGKTQKLAVRVGGIYGLERIANESAKDRGRIIEVLITYIRERTPRTKTKCNELTPRELAMNHFPEDIQAALNVIESEAENKFTDNEIASISQADLSGGAQLKNVHFAGAYLSLTDLSGADLRNADLHGAFFTYACLAGADLRGADLTGAHFEGATLHEARLGWDRNNKKSTRLVDPKDLNQAQLDDTNGDHTMVTPPGFTRPARWEKEQR